MKRIEKYIFLVLCALSAGRMAHAQQEVMYSQYMDVQLYANPAYAGSGDVLNISAIHRQQWVGVDGAPQTTGLLVHTPLGKNLGVGLDIMNDKAGVLGRMSASGNIAYQLRLGSKSKLNFGLKGTFDQYSASESALLGAEKDILGQNSPIQAAINVGFGVYYKNEKMFFGIGAPRILAQDLDKNNGYVPLQQHGFAIVGAIFKLNKEWKFRPTVQARATAGSPVSTELTATAIYADKLWFGAMYRTSSATGAYAQFNINRQFKIGYAYDFPLAVGKINTQGSHEITLSYDLDFHENGVASPRFF